MTGRVAVTGASGKSGRAVTAALVARGAEVVPIGRRAGPRLAGVLRGCDAAYLIAPNLHPDEPALVAEALAAARQAGVGRVVHHSVAAPYAPAMPHHLGKARAEDRVRRSGLPWTILQPCAYVENLLPPLQNGEATLRVPYDVRRPFGLVHLGDVAEAAATVLLDGGHVGATYELGGPRLVTVADVAEAASAVLGRPVRAERQAPEAWAAGPGAGLPPRERAWLLAMFGCYDEHGLPTGALPLTSLLGRPPTGVAAVLRALPSPAG